MIRCRRQSAPVLLTALYLGAEHETGHGDRVGGVDVSYQAKDGRTVHDKAWLLDIEEPENNDWLVANQFTVIDERAPELVDAQGAVDECHQVP